MLTWPRTAFAPFPLQCEALCLHGTCTTEQPFRCVCNPGHSGERCEIEPPTLEPTRSPSGSPSVSPTENLPDTCANVTGESGVYRLAGGFSVYCLMDDGGNDGIKWTKISFWDRHYSMTTNAVAPEMCARQSSSETCKLSDEQINSQASGDRLYRLEAGGYNYKMYLSSTRPYVDSAISFNIQPANRDTGARGDVQNRFPGVSDGIGIIALRWWCVGKERGVSLWRAIMAVLLQLLAWSLLTCRWTALPVVRVDLQVQSMREAPQFRAPFIDFGSMEPSVLHHGFARAGCERYVMGHRSEGADCYGMDNTGYRCIRGNCRNSHEDASAFGRNCGCGDQGYPFITHWTMYIADV